MGTTTPEVIRTEVYVDRGPVLGAISVLLTESTLADHLLRQYEASDAAAIRVYHDPDGVPFALWGSGTQALWRLLCSITYTADPVSLYEVVSRLDSRNRRAVAAAIAELCS